MSKLALREPAEIEPDREGGFHVALVLAEPFDYDYSFRGVLEQLVQKLNASGQPANLELPLHTEREDFIFGSLTWRGEKFPVYFEHSLGYLDFRAPTRASLDQLMNIALS